MKQTKSKKLLYAIIGSAAGILNGFFGSGGGALCVPASRNFLGISPHEAHASTIAVMLPMTVVSVIFYATQARPELWQVLAVSAGGVVGGYFGAKLLPKLPPNALRRIFGVFIAAAGLKMLL